MKRRDFLKLIGAAPFVGLAAKAIQAETLPIDYKRLQSLHRECSRVLFPRPVGIAVENIPKDGYGWLQVGPHADFGFLFEPHPFYEELKKRGMIKFL